MPAKPLTMQRADTSYTAVFSTAYTAVTYSASQPGNAINLVVNPSSWTGKFDYYKLKSVMVHFVINGSGMSAPFAVAYEPVTWSGSTTFSAVLAHENSHMMSVTPDNSTFSFKIPKPARITGATSSLNDDAIGTDNSWSAGTIEYTPGAAVTGTLLYSVSYEVEFMGGNSVQ